MGFRHSFSNYELCTCENRFRPLTVVHGARSCGGLRNCGSLEKTDERMKRITQARGEV